MTKKPAKRKKTMKLEEFKKVQSEFMKQSQQVLASEFKDFFEKYPEIDAVRWIQYTPHFNDGDVCEFGRYGFDARVHSQKETQETGDEELISSQEVDEDGFYEGYSIDAKTTLGKALSQLEDTFDSDTNELLKSAFGDGVKIVATRKGFKVEDYDHD
jgi:hypothetical protein